jgi:hypothetical protein
MFANKDTGETAGQNVAEGIALVKALGASVQDSALKIEQVNKGFVEALAGVKAADGLFCAQADYVQGFGQVTQDTVLDLTNLTHRAMARYLDRVSAQLGASSSVAQAVQEPEAAVVAEPAAPAEEPEVAVVAEPAVPVEEPEVAAGEQVADLFNGQSELPLVVSKHARHGQGCHDGQQHQHYDEFDQCERASELKS